jgi:SAM-dependent methyltransferase
MCSGQLSGAGRRADAAVYEAWYHTARGRWIGDIEFRLLRKLLRPGRGASLLDVGCGTGYFTRRFAAECELRVVALDPDPAWIELARARGGGTERYCRGRAEALPFPDRSFDYTVSVTALCFAAEERASLREMLRVTRRRFALGLLNRHSLLYLRKGRGSGTGSYRGAHWHTGDEIRSLLDGLLARGIERVLPRRLPVGGFIVVAGDVSRPSTAVVAR